MRTLSCDSGRLYEKGGLYDLDEPDSAFHDVKLGTWIGNVYPAYGYDRPAPNRIVSARADAEDSLRGKYAGFNSRFRSGASGDAFAIENAILYDRSIYTVLPPGELVEVYETNRSVDRPWKTVLDASQLGDCLRPSASDVDYVYCSSVGSENYAHWLVDDLPRLKGVVALLDPGKTVVVLDRYFDQIDDIRRESIQAVVGLDRSPKIVFIDKKKPHFFDRLTYVSPVSLTPVLKCPAGIAYLYEGLRDAAAPSPKRLFVGRNALWRGLLNAKEVAEFFGDLSFTIVTIDFGSMSFAQQVSLFSNAEVIVGVSGASMANTIFSPPSTKVFYLAGEGFTDPWYWDLAAVKQHEYSVCFGPQWKPEAPNFSSFRIERPQLEELAAFL